MSNIPLPDDIGCVDTFTRTEGADTVHMQAIVPVDPVTGDPLQLAQEATLAALNAAVATLNTAAAAIQSAVEAINGKTVAVDTADVTVASLPASVAQDATVQAIHQLNDTMLYMLSAMLDKMPRLDRTDRVTVDMADYGVGGGASVLSQINGTTNPNTGATFYRIFEPWNFSDVGCARLYQQIQVSP